MTSHIKCTLTLSIILLQLILICPYSTAYIITTLEPKSAPDNVAFLDDNGDEHFLDEFEDHLILLVFWATWCSPCASEIVDLDILQKDFKELPFRVVAISQDYQGIKPVREFFRIYNIKYLPLYTDDKNRLYNAFDVKATPTSFLINQKGKVVTSFIGIIDWYDENIRNMLLSFFPNTDIEPKSSTRPLKLNQEINKKSEESGSKVAPIIDNEENNNNNKQ